MFAPRISKGQLKASKSASTIGVGQDSPWLGRQTPRYVIRNNSEDQASGPYAAWRFDEIPLYPPAQSTTAAASDGNAGTRTIVKRQRLAFSATLPAAKRGSQSDAMSADKRDPAADSEMPVSKAALSEPGGKKPGRRADNGGEAIPIPDGVLTSISGEHADAITSHLAYHSTITQEGPPPAGEFGKTYYSLDFKPENFSVARRAGTPGTPDSPGAKGTPATPPAFEVSGDVPCKITFQVTAHGRTNIASDADPSITQTNFLKVVTDLTPSTAAVNQGGLSLLKNQPPRTKFWAEDLTIKHERFHCAEDDRFAGQAVRVAQDWLSARAANTPDELFALLAELPRIAGNEVRRALAAPTDEKRAYDAGAPDYVARVQAIKRKGDAKGYVPQPPAPAPQALGSQAPNTPKAPAPQPAPGPAQTPTKQ